MKNKLFRTIIAIMLIIAITVADFALLGTHLVSYALENINDSTNNANIKFATYFKTDGGEEVSKIEYPMNDTEMKLYVKLSVENGEFFGGIITLKDANFKFKQEYKSDKISKIEDQKVTLKNVIAGNASEIEIELGIEPIVEESYAQNMLSMENTIKLEGSYKYSVDGKETTESVETEKKVTLTLKTPSELETTLKAKTITNRIYKIDETEKRIIQIEINSSVVENAYPIKASTFEVELPEGVEVKEVITKGTYATNGEADRKLEYTVSESNTLKVAIENASKDGKISWKKDAEDSIIITLHLGKDVELGADEYTVKAAVELYDGQTRAKEATYNLTEEADGIITTSVENKEVIYKGKIYAKQEREYNVTTNIEINYASLIESATLEEVATYRTEKEAADMASNIQYKTTTISKVEIEKILGEEGTLTIKSGSQEIAITKDTQADENGNIVITHDEGVKELQVEITKAVETGIIRLNHTKVIKAEEYTREQITQIKYLLDKATVKYSTAENSFSRIKTLQETKSEIIFAAPEKISALDENKEVEITITLKTDDEKYELYENPTFTLTMPEGITVNSVSNGAVSASVEELAISKLETNGQRGITLQISGAQQEYLTSDINTQIKFKANVNVERLMANKVDTIKMQYTNKGVTNNVESTPINIIASNSKIVTYLQLENYNGLGTTIEKFSDSANGVKGKLPLENAETIEVPIKYAIINNYSTDMTLSSILEARLTDAEEEETILINSFEEAITIKAGEVKTIEQVLSIPAGLYYSEKIDVNTLVEYNYSGTKYSVSNQIGLYTQDKQGIREIKIIDDKIELETFAQLSDGTGIKENDEIYNEQIVKYIIEVTNITNKPISDIVITNTQENGNIYDLKEEVVVNYVESTEEKIEHKYEELDTNTKTFEIETLQPGESKEIVCRVVAKKTETNNVTTANITFEANGISAQNVTISNNVKDADLKIFTEKALNEEVQMYGDMTLHMLTYIENLTASEINNSKVRLYLSEGLTWNESYTLEALDMTEETIDILSDINYNAEENYLEFNITTLGAGERIIISSLLYIKAIPLEETSRDEVVYAEINDILSNATEINVKQLQTALSILQTTNIQEGQKVKDGEKIIITAEVTNIGSIDDIATSIDDKLPEGLEVEKVELIRNGVAVDLTAQNEKSAVGISTDIKKGEKIIVKIEVIVNTSRIVGNEVTNKIIASPYTGEIAISNEITIKIESNVDDNLGFEEEPTEPDKEPDDVEINDEDPNEQKPDDGKPDDGKPDDGKPDDGKPDDGKPDDGKDEEEKTYSISGHAWADKDKDAIQDANEAIKDVIVKLIDLDNKNTLLKDKNGNEIEVKTDANGEYKIESIPEGNYNLIFKYDTSMYEIKQNIGLKDYTVESTKEKVAITNNINLKSDQTIDLQLLELAEFDLKIDKYITKVVVQTPNEVKTSVYANKQLVREEIKSKYLSNATVLVEYTMEISNTGELAGYATQITDYLPSDMKFHSELNTQWYMGEDGNIYNTSLASTKINPGETKTIKLVLIKTMTKENTGTVANIVEISDETNIREYADLNLNNNQSKAEIIINPATGAIITYTVAILNSIAIAVVGIYIIKRKVMKQ